ncbi:MAG: hypothetical protein ACI37T_08005 [Candidatus Gastranaerophilaceae bacterium]
MSAAQMPENMGKKIVEALKRQALYEDDYTNFDTEEQTINEIEEPAESKQINETPAKPAAFTETQNTVQSIGQFSDTQPAQFSISQNPQPTAYNSFAPELPTNVAVLKKLIMQLPAGVSKQVGAQIIRQTVEALGISMNSVLQEAQQVQDTLNSAVSECSAKMQEYKNQIMQLEANARDYQRQMSQISDLISLFILTDKK